MHAAATCKFMMIVTTEEALPACCYTDPYLGFPHHPKSEKEWRVWVDRLSNGHIHPTAELYDMNLELSVTAQLPCLIGVLIASPKRASRVPVAFSIQRSWRIPR